MTSNKSTNSPDEPNQKPDHFGEQLLEIWHRGSAWILGPVLVGLLAVGLALGSEQMGIINAHLNKLHPYAPLIFMPLGFALLCSVTLPQSKRTLTDSHSEP